MRANRPECKGVQAGTETLLRVIGSSYARVYEYTGEEMYVGLLLGMSRVLVYIALWQMCYGIESPTIVTAEAGQDVTLPCICLYDSTNIVGVQWSRTDIEEEYVYLRRDGQHVPEYQHPSFAGRVCLQDRDMRKGNLSIIIRQIKSEDNGLYVCYVLTQGKRKVRDATQINIVLLKVSPADLPADKQPKTRGEGGLFAPSVFVVACALVTACVIRNLASAY